ncbi:2Fe-2S iron-sulfur cluster-binding protein [Lysobacter korlensis]|uniref:2Fe-2S iron-sulfur cluster-binding protein n=1 Tax=Lysobacter korlensis TaxID=553636 RepID=A0ABV6RP13_9GAMM
MNRTPLAEVAAVPPQGAGALTVAVDGVEVGLYRVGERIVAWRNVCPHGAAPVCRGTVDGTRLTSAVYEYEYGRDQEILQCPWHGWEFDLLSGEHLAEGSAARLRRHPIAVIDGVVYDDAPVPARMRLRVTERVRAADDIVVLRLASPDGAALPAWMPGTHLEVSLPSGLVRHYSLCGDPADRSSYRIAVLRERSGRGGSAELFAESKAGLELDVRALRNRFRLREAKHSLLIAGGIGITPLLPMAASLHRRRRSFELVYTGRDLASMALADEAAALPNARLVESSLQGRPDLRALLAEAPEGTAVYACGPAGMIAQVRALAAAEGDRIQVFTEAFEGGEPEPSGHGPARPLAVELARSGATVRVEAGETVLHAVRNLVPSAPSSCEQGWCGTCETRVLDGEPDHRDRVLTEGERESGDTMMICVSRARSERLVLDL